MLSDDEIVGLVLPAVARVLRGEASSQSAGAEVMQEMVLRAKRANKAAYDAAMAREPTPPGVIGN
jgi:hypothetical protein